MCWAEWETFGKSPNKPKTPGYLDISFNGTSTENFCKSADKTKGQALVDKAGARTDFSYVPRHLGEF